MTQRLKDELKQIRPFRSLEEEVALELARTADALNRRFEVLLKPNGLTGTQYNVLRILRGAGSAGLSCGEVASRMVTRDPDLTRLLDRLETRALATRARDGEDRRVVTTRITKAGLDLLAQLDEPVLSEHRQGLGHLGKEKLRKLAELLDELRGGAS